MLLVFFEELVIKAFLVLRIPRFMEVVHIELAHERGEVIMFEILWQYILGKGITVFNAKAIAVLVPENDVLIICVVYYFVCFCQKVRNLITCWHTLEHSVLIVLRLWRCL